MITAAGGVTLVGGGALDASALEDALRRAPLLVAADGGADAAMALGHRPDWAVGDFDSISAKARAAIGADRCLHIAEQDSTDFDKALRNVQADFVLAVGFSGKRLDHTLAGLNVLIRHARRRCVMIAQDDIVFAAPPQIHLPLSPGQRVSLFPMGQVTGRSTGLRWPIEGIGFAPEGRIGTSNEATGSVELHFDGPMLVMLPRDCLDLALDALSDARSG